MELELLENKQTLNSRTLSIIINLNPCLAENETLLLSYYKRVRATWSNSAIKAVQKTTGLKLTSKLNRCQFSIEAAKQELQFMQAENHEINCYLEGEELPVANNQIIEELPSIPSLLVSVLERVAHGEALSLGGFPDLRKVPNPKGGNPQDRARPLPLLGKPERGWKGVSNSFKFVLLADLFGDKTPSPRTAFQVAEFNQEQEEQLNAQKQLQIAQEQINKLEAQLKEKEEQLEQEKEELEQSNNFAVLLLTNRLLAPGLPLNGTEDSPAMRILGSPKTLTELEANYRELIKREHPDVSPFAQDEAINRFAYVRSLYRITREHWHCLKPTATITKTMLSKRMKAPVPFDPKSFWAA